MKSILFLICICWSFLLSAQAPLMDITSNISKGGIFSNNPDLSITDFNNKSETDNCKFYLKYPPVVSFFFNTEESWEKIEINVKDEYSNYDIELGIKFHFYYSQEEINYKMYDDGTFGDSIENDHVFTNNNVYFPHMGNELVETISPCPITMYIRYLSNNTLIHTDEVWMDFYNINSDFLANLKEPEFKYLNHGKSVIWADNFIVINKNLNWIELDNQQHGNGCWFDYNYIESESILYNYWDELQIINHSDNNFYLQADFIEPFGQYAYPDGETMFLGTSGLFGPFVHELLHRWNVEMNKYLGFPFDDTFGGHYAGITRNTSGFLYQSYSKHPWMYSEGAEKTIIQENDSTYSVLQKYPSEGKNKQVYNDFEQYIMGLLPIDSVKLPIYFLSGFIKNEDEIDSATGYWTEVSKIYFKNLVEIDKSRLEDAKKRFLEDHNGDDNFLSGDTVNVIPVFNLTKNPSLEELKIINFFCSDLSRKGSTKMNYKFYGLDFLTYYEATQGKGIVVCNVPTPKNQIVNAGTDQIVNEGEIVTLNGYASSNPGGNKLTYKWSAPPGITMSSTTVANPTFTAPEVNSDTIFTFSLVVNDGTIDSPDDKVVITVKNVIKVGNTEISAPVIKVYPNPSAGIITLELNQKSGKKTEVSVSNLIGNEIFRKELTNVGTYLIDLTNQVSGIYLLKVFIDNQQYINKFVIQKQ